MSGNDLNAWVSRIEAHLEAGRLDDAKQTLAAARAAVGELPQLHGLQARIVEVEALASPEPVDSLVRQAQEQVNRANYEAAQDLLHQALQIRPDDGSLLELRERTAKAAARHHEAQARQRAILSTAEEIGKLLEEGRLSTARDRLQEAGIEFGRHNALATLQQRLASLETEAAEHRIRGLEERLNALIEAGNWRGAKQEAEKLLRLSPQHPRGQALLDESRQQIERLESRRHYRSALETAKQDIERLLTAKEVQRAAQRLQEAVGALGRDPAFDDLQARIHRARSDHQFRQRVEWAERRANEAEGLIREANRLSIQGSFEEAVERLEAAQELDPSHPHIPDKLATAYAARDRQLEERQRFEALAANLQDIRGHLDALRLDQAGLLIARSRQEFEAEEQLVPLIQRYEKLRAAEQVSARLSQLAPEDVTPGATMSLLRDRQDVWIAYSWKQALLFPFRGQGPTLLALLVLGLMVLDGLTALPWIGPFFSLLRLAVPVTLLALAPALSRATVGGRNHLPGLPELLRDKRWLADALSLYALGLLLLAPVLLWVSSRTWHGQLSATAGPLGWWIACLLLWPACAFGITALGAAATFGDGQLFRLPAHAKALLSMPSSGLLLIHGLFIVSLAILLLRAVVVPSVPWLGVPIQAALEAYGLLALPHLVGSLMRRRGVDLAKLYV